MQLTIPKGKKIIQLTNSEYDIGKGYPVNYALLGDVKLVLRQMIEEINAGPKVTEKKL
jgi:thiamine pyrophosphate-dependent acetolactate synthase large subunit-like protein